MNLETRQLKVDWLALINPVLPKGKQVRQNSLDLASAQQLFEGTLAKTQDAQAIFIEVPVGSQSARAMASYGICVGVLGALRGSSIPFFEVTPTEVKMATVGSKTATKDEMIRWATKTHPEADWPVYKHLGASEVSSAKAEHMADAIGAIHAGIHTTTFNQMVSLLAPANQGKNPCKFN